MNFLTGWFGHKPTPSDAARTLAKHAAEFRRLMEREKMCARTRQLREECKLPPHEAFGGDDG